MVDVVNAIRVAFGRLMSSRLRIRHRSGATISVNRRKVTFTAPVYSPKHKPDGLDGSLDGGRFE
jgi:hypothetical protein